MTVEVSATIRVLRSAAICVLAWGSVAMALGGFFLPWAMIDLRAPETINRVAEAVGVEHTLSGLKHDLGRIVVKVRRGAETITGTLPSLEDIPKQVSGAQIPRLLNQRDAKAALALVELITRNRQNVGMKSYAVYFVPGIALLCGLLLTVWGRHRLVAWAVALICAGIASVGFWELSRTDVRTLVAVITIGRGLWLSLWAYGGLTLAALLSGLGGSARVDSRH